MVNVLVLLLVFLCLLWGLCVASLVFIFGFVLWFVALNLKEHLTNLEGICGVVHFMVLCLICCLDALLLFEFKYYD